MAAIPTFVYVGSDQINGGQGSARAPTEGAASQFLGGLWGMYRHWPTFAQSVPADPTTGLPPASPAYSPYWDGYRALSWGAVASATANTLTVAGTPWTPSAFIGMEVYIVSGTGSTQRRTISANTNNTLTVSSNWTTNPDATSRYEVQSGAFVVFHHLNSISSNMLVPIVAGSHGDNWYEFGGGVTPCTMLMQKLGERFGGTSPYFKVFKHAMGGGVGVGATTWTISGTSTAGASWTLFESLFATMTAAMGSDTPDTKCVFIDASSPDIIAANVNYENDLQQLVTRMRTKFPTALLVLVSHHRDMGKTTAPSVAHLAHSINVAIAKANANVLVFDMNWATFAMTSITAPVTPADPIYYDTESYVQAGVRMFNVWDGWQKAAPAAVAGSGIAVVVVIADSQGSTLNTLQAVHGRQATILGENGTNIRAGQYVYNGQTRSVLLYDVLVNAHTTPTQEALFGFETTLLKSMGLEFPDGVVLFKFAKSGAAVTSEAKAAGATGAYESAANDLWPSVISHWNDCKQSIVDDLDRIADVQAVVVALGDNEDTNSTVAAAFAAKVEAFVTQLRSVFRTRAGGPDLPVVWLQPPKHISLSGGQSNHGNAQARETVRQAVLDLEGDDDRVTVLRSNASKYELQRDDGQIHYGAEGSYAIGYDAAEAILDLNEPARLNTTAVAEDDDVEPDPAAADTINAATVDAPDVKRYRTPDGLEVERRSVEEMIRLENHQESRQARRDGVKRTRASFG